MDANICRIDDFGPLPVVQPASVAELSDIVRGAALQDQAIYPYGGRTMLDHGLPPTRPGIAVDLRGLTQVIEYPARDMTITVQAGITLAKLGELLRPENQRLPIDVPDADRATLGGALATNVSGPRRLGHGTLRDYVIGITVVNDEGHEAKAGGRVVKNVAGYDLCKLYIGALGTLGIISQVTLKLRPLADEQALVILTCEPHAVAALLDALHRSRTRPVCLELLNDAAVAALNVQHPGLLPDAPRVLIVGYEEKRETVAWQVQQLIAELPAGTLKSLESRVGSTADPLWQWLVEFPAWSGALLTFKANLLPGATAEFFAKAADLPEGLALQAHAGSGIVLGHATDALTLERARAMLAVLEPIATAAQGNIVLRRCPTAWKATLPVWGKPREDLWLMRAVRQQLDPKERFNPGRFLV
ncbi:MAG: FAD-binding oxidoreductase [Gemmataceae bacterium]|nr:FAD-binding oxidoreductase [Gemmataceae bacterium]